MGPHDHRRADAERRRDDQAVEGGPLTRVVVDASFALQACLEEAGFGVLAGHEALAPALMWSEVLSTLHESAYRGEITRQLADLARPRLWTASVRSVPITDHGEGAWRVAGQLGWAKTNDAEYVALAQALGCPLVTVDQRLQRGAGHLVEIVGPQDLVGRR